MCQGCRYWERHFFASQIDAEWGGGRGLDHSQRIVWVVVVNFDAKVTATLQVWRLARNRLTPSQRLRWVAELVSFS